MTEKWSWLYVGVAGGRFGQEGRVTALRSIAVT
jgi:hypothetical protein